MSVDPLVLGVGAGVLGIILTFMMPVSPRRVNQTMVSALVVLLFFVAALALFPFPPSLLVGLAASVLAVLYRDVMRWVKHTVYGVTKYRRRDYWYRQVGRAVVGGSARRRGRRR